MTANVDQIKGKVKKSAGELTGNQKLKNEGRVDVAVGNAKSFVSKTGTKVKNAAPEIDCGGCD